MRIAWRVALVLLTTTVLYRGLFNQVRIAGVALDVLLLLAIVAGISGGPDGGAAVGFASGLTVDLLTGSPLGLHAFTYCLVGYGTGLVEGSVVRSSAWLPMLTTAAATVAGLALFVAVSSLVGYSVAQNRPLWPIMLVCAIGNALLAPLAIRVMRWAFGPSPRVRPLLR